MSHSDFKCQVNNWNIHWEICLRFVFTDILPQPNDNPLLPQREQPLRVWQRAVQNSPAFVVRSNPGQALLSIFLPLLYNTPIREGTCRFLKRSKRAERSQKCH